jgi:hypothetical protein
MTMMAMATTLSPKRQHTAADHRGSLPAHLSAPHEKADGLHRYISGPHFPDYYLLLDEEADQIFAMRLAMHAHEAGDMCGLRGGVASASLVEICVDDAANCIWYVFDVRCRPASDTDSPELSHA